MIFQGGFSKEDDQAKALVVLYPCFERPLKEEIASNGCTRLVSMDVHDCCQSMYIVNVHDWWLFMYMIGGY